MPVARLHRFQPLLCEERQEGGQSEDSFHASSPWPLHAGYIGMMTLSITWMTPLSATISVLVTVAPSTITLP